MNHGEWGKTPDRPLLYKKVLWYKEVGERDTIERRCVNARLGVSNNNLGRLYTLNYWYQ